MSWRDLAACQGMDTDLFFPAENIGGPRRGKGISGEKERMEQAKGICSSCQVRQECLDYALGSGEEFGVYGGMTPKERQRYYEGSRCAS